MRSFLLCVLVASAFTATPTRPVVSNVFEANGEMRVTPNGGEPVSGLGQWAIDQPKGMGVEHFEFPNGDIYWEVQRFDTGNAYSADRFHCNVSKLQGSMHAPWAWLATATFNGTRQIGQITVDVWQGVTANGIPSEAAFLSGENTKPVYVRRQLKDAVIELFFRIFTSAPSQPGWFVPPFNCRTGAEPKMKFFNSTAELGCPQWAMYKQCDPAWARQELGHSSDTICSAGCAMSSVAMYLTTRGHPINPSGLNGWLDGHGGYVGGDEIVWGSVNAFGVAFQGIENPSEAVVADGLAQCHGIIANVRGGSHWVLLTGHPSAGVFSVNDPGFNQGSYAFNTMLRMAVYH